MSFPAWLGASITIAAAVWAVEQYSMHYAWVAALLTVLSVFVVRLQKHPEALQGFFVPWDPSISLGTQGPPALSNPNPFLPPPRTSTDPATPF